MADASSDVREYNPAKISVTYGPVQVTGYAGGSFVVVTRKNDEVAEVEGADGSITIVHNASKLATITLTLSQTSPTNAALSAMLEAAELAGQTLVQPFMLTDKGGTTVVAMSKAWVRKRADAGFGKDQTDRVWTFGGIADKHFVGGN